MSINIELPSNNSLKLLAPQKEKTGILEPMSYISKGIKLNKLDKSKFKPNIDKPRFFLEFVIFWAIL